MTLGPKQLQVLRLLNARGLMDTEQIKALAFEESSARSCQLRLAAQYRICQAPGKRGVQEYGVGGGSTMFVYTLSEDGARVVAEATRIPLNNIPRETDPGHIRAYLATYKLTVNRCLIALWKAAQDSHSLQIIRWNSDPHIRMHYRGAAVGG